MKTKDHSELRPPLLKNKELMSMKMYLELWLDYLLVKKI